MTSVGRTMTPLPCPTLLDSSEKISTTTDESLSAAWTPAGTTADEFAERPTKNPTLKQKLALQIVIRSPSGILCAGTWSPVLKYQFLIFQGLTSFPLTSPG